MIFSCGPREAEARTLPRTLWRKDNDGIHYFKRAAPLHIYRGNKLEVVRGPVVFVAHADDFWGGEASKPYRSKVIVDPTFQSLYSAACTAQKKTGDRHHAFIEGAFFKRVEVIDGVNVTVLELSLGS